MFFTKAFVVAALLAITSASALPVQEGDAAIEKRANPGFYFCVNTGFNGQCYKDNSPAGNCGNLPRSPPGFLNFADISFCVTAVTTQGTFDNSVSSAGPDQGVHCILYEYVLPSSGF